MPPQCRGLTRFPPAGWVQMLRKACRGDVGDEDFKDLIKDMGLEATSL
jgi:hypothetical protein